MPRRTDHIKRGEVSLNLNTPSGRASHRDEQEIWQAALRYNVPCVTTMAGAPAVVEAIASRKGQGAPDVCSLQELHAAAESPAFSTA